MQTINVELNPQETVNYPITIGVDASSKIAECFAKLNAKKALVVTNETIYELYEEFLPKIFSSSAVQLEYCILPDGEVFKNAEMLEKILTCAFEAKLERTDLFVAFGGGVIGDITGFAAAIYLRGVKFVQIPTTILAQVDSSVGGKVAINTPYGKNLLGAFYQPRAVVSDLTFLKTLPKREILTGLAEVLKYSFIEKICGLDFFDFANFLAENTSAIIKTNFEITENMIKKCCELKAAVVKQDERENGVRAILNFGHTIGHAIEKTTQYKVFTHGEAVSIGIKGAFLISLKTAKIGKEYFAFAQKLLDDYGFNFKIPQNIEPEKIFDAISYDKKVRNKQVRWVLPTDYAQVEIFDDIDAAIVLDVIKELY